MRRRREDDEPQPSDPKAEPLRKDMQPDDFGQFLQRTRRYHKLTRRRREGEYARGLDSKPEDFA